MAWWNALSSHDVYVQPNVNRNLKYLRVRNGLSLGQLSKELGIPRGSIGCYESCGSISPWRLEVFANFYGVDSEMLKMKPEEFIKEMEKEDSEA